MIVGIILAGGASLRMGKPKPLLTIGQETFLQHITHTLQKARINETVVVLGAYGEEIQSTLTWYSGKIVMNSEWQSGQLSSLKAGLSRYKTEDIHGVLVYPVDHPLVSQEVLVEMLHCFWTSDKNIIVPTFEGKRGHPVIFGRTMIEKLKSASNEKGAKEVVYLFPDEILEVPVNDVGILLNIDTPEDYQTYILKSNV